MALFDNLSKRATEAGQKAIQKTRELSEISRVSGLISDAEKTINNTYFQIGKLYAEIHRYDAEENFASMIKTIVLAEEKIEDYRKQIEDVKGIQHCEKCGAEVPKGAVYCSVCGTLMPKIDSDNMSAYLKCAHCGSLVEKGMRFCTSCGKPLEFVQTLSDSEVEAQECMSEVDSLLEASSAEDIEAKSSASKESDTIQCKTCGALNDSGASFCTSCGTQIESGQTQTMPEIETTQEKHCPNCGAKLEPDVLFCTECGTKL